MPGKKKRAADNCKLTKADLKSLKDAMIQYRAKLSGDMDSIKEEALKPSDQDFSVDHMADYGSDNFDKDMNLGLIENVGRTLGEIDQALKRMEKGEYGHCGACNHPVPKARLEYLPWVRFCVDCQTKLEKGELLLEEEESE